MEFQFRYHYTQEDMETLSRATAKTFGRRKTLAARLVLAILGAIYIGIGSVLATGGEEGNMGTMVIGAGVIFCGLAMFYHRVSAWRSRRRVTDDMGEFVITLEDKGIRGKSRRGEDLCRYSDVIGAFHYRQRYLLFLDPKHAMLLPERALVRGEPGDVAPFLSKKLKQEIQELR